MEEQKIIDPRVAFSNDMLAQMALTALYLQTIRKVPFSDSLPYLAELLQINEVPGYTVRAWELIYKDVALARYRGYK